MADQIQNTRTRTKIKTAEKAKTTYTPAAKGGQFRPVAAVNSLGQVKQWQQAIAADARTMARELARDQQQERLEVGLGQRVQENEQKLKHGGETRALQSEQLYEKQKQGLDHAFQKADLAVQGAHLTATHTTQKAKLTAASSITNALIGLSQTYSETAFKAEELKRADEIAQQQHRTMGITGKPGDPIPESGAFDAETRYLLSESSVLNAEANGLEETNIPSDTHVSGLLRENTAFNQLRATRNNPFEAKAQLIPFLEEIADLGIIRPGQAGVEDMKYLMFQFSKATGLIVDTAAQRDKLNKFFYPFAQEKINQILRKVNADDIKARRESNEIEIDNSINNLAKSADINTIGDQFKLAVNEEVHGFGTGNWNGKNSTAATEATLVKFLTALEAEGKTDLIEKLHNSVYNDSTGRTVGQDFGHLFDESKTRADKKAIDAYNLKIKKAELEVRKIVDAYKEDPTAQNRLKTYKALLSSNGGKPTMAAIKEAQKLAETGFGYEPTIFHELNLRLLAGGWIPTDELEGYLNSGQITENEYKYFSTVRGHAGRSIKKANEKLKESNYVKNLVESRTKNSIDPDTLRILPHRAALFESELKRLVHAELRVRPEIGDNDTTLTQLIEDKITFLSELNHFGLHPSDKNLTEGAFTLSRLTLNDKQNNVLAELPRIPGDTSVDRQDWTGINFRDLFEKPESYPRFLMQANRDYFLTNEELGNAVKHYIQSSGKGLNLDQVFKDFPEITYLAEKLGLSEVAFLEAQAAARGYPDLKTQRNMSQRAEIKAEVDPNKLSSSEKAEGDILNMRSGMRILQEEYAIPSKGAAYIAGNIQELSRWHGNRRWQTSKFPSIDGQGNIVNIRAGIGGLSGVRLEALEKQFGTTIENVTEEDQLRWIINDIKTNYPMAWAILNNPNAKDSSMRFAIGKYFPHTPGIGNKYATRLHYGPIIGRFRDPQRAGQIYPELNLRDNALTQESDFVDTPNDPFNKNAFLTPGTRPENRHNRNTQNTL